MVVPSDLICTKLVARAKRIISGATRGMRTILAVVNFYLINCNFFIIFITYLQLLQVNLHKCRRWWGLPWRRSRTEFSRWWRIFLHHLKPIHRYHECPRRKCRMWSCLDYYHRMLWWKHMLPSRPLPRQRSVHSLCRWNIFRDKRGIEH